MPPINFAHTAIQRPSRKVKVIALFSLCDSALLNRVVCYWLKSLRISPKTISCSRVVRLSSASVGVLEETSVTVENHG